MEEQNKLKEDERAIEAKQHQHQEKYKKERERLAHLSWKQRKAALYRTNKHHMTCRPSEKAEPEKISLPLIVKGEMPCRVMCRSVCVLKHSCSFTQIQAVIIDCYFHTQVINNQNLIYNKAFHLTCR